MSPCDEYLDLISARLDGELSPLEEARLEAHLARCGGCRQLADQLADLHDAMCELPILSVPDGLTEKITAAVEQDNVTPISAARKRSRWKVLLSTAALLALALVGGKMSGLFDLSRNDPAYQPDETPHQAAYTVGADGDTAGPAVQSGEAAIARTASFPDQDVLALCAAELFPEGRLTAQPTYDPEASTLTLELADEGPLTLTCTQLDPEGISTVELTWADGTPETWLVDLIAGTVTRKTP